MLAALTDRDRWGRGDHTKREIVADYLQDLGRDEEAALLRSGKHVVVHEGRVKPGRFTLEHLEQATRRVDDHIHEPTPRVGYHRMDYGLDFVGPDPTGEYESAIIHEPGMEDDGMPAYQSLPNQEAHHWDHETNTPVVRWNDHGCADGEVPIGKLREHLRDDYHRHADWMVSSGYNTPEVAARVKAASEHLLTVPIDEPADTPRAAFYHNRE